jgi:hypothetical protein
VSPARHARPRRVRPCRSCGGSDEAHRAFGVDCAEPFRHPRLQEAEAVRPQHIDRDEIAVAGLALGTRSHLELATAHIALVDGHDAAAATGTLAKDAEQLGLGTRQELDHAPAIGRLPLGRARQELDTQEHAIADARRGGPRPWLPWQADRDPRHPPLLLVPFRGHGDEIAVAVLRDDVGEDDVRQDAALVQIFAAPLDRAVRLQLPQQALQGDAIIAFDVEGAGDLTLADLARSLPAGGLTLARDEGENVFS